MHHGELNTENSRASSSHGNMQNAIRVSFGNPWQEFVTRLVKGRTARTRSEASPPSSSSYWRFMILGTHTTPPLRDLAPTPMMIYNLLTIDARSTSFHHEARVTLTRRRAHMRRPHQPRTISRLHNAMPCSCGQPAGQSGPSTHAPSPPYMPCHAHVTTGLARPPRSAHRKTIPMRQYKCAQIPLRR
jgi:hypothetical protein